MTTPQFDPNLLAYLQAWRQYLEQAAGSATAGFGIPAAPQWPVAAPPPMPPMPPPLSAPPAFPPSPPTDYTQQLLATLQAWRQYLEHSNNAPTVPIPAPGPMPVAAPVAAPPDAVHRPHAKKESVPPPHEGPQIVPPAYTVTAEPPAPARRPGSAYAAESSSAGHPDFSTPAARSLYSTAATANTDGPSTTTTWWDAGRPPPADVPAAGSAGTTPSSQAPSTPTDSTGQSIGTKIPPNLETQAPRVVGGSMNPKDLVRPVARTLEAIQPSFRLSR